MHLTMIRTPKLRGEDVKRKEKEVGEEVEDCDFKRQRMSSYALDAHIESTPKGCWEIQLKAPSGLVDVCLSVDLPSYKLLGLPTPAPSNPLRLDSLADTGSDACGISSELFANFGTG